MALRNRIPALLKMVENARSYLALNEKLFKIYSGDLLPFIEAALRQQMSEQKSYELARQRIPPINVLRRIIAKQSKLYAQAPTRTVDTDLAAAADLLAWYEKQLKVNQSGSLANSYFNLFKTALWEPYLSQTGRPSLRVIPSSQFVPISDGYNDEMPSGFIILLGKRTVGNSQVEVYKAVTAYEICYFTADGDDLTPAYMPPNNPDGVNELGRLPYVYVNRDPCKIMPTQDTDMFAMTVLIPLLLTDINFAHMFQAFAILYGINVDFENLKFGPNALWSFKTPPGLDPAQKPEVGSIKPQADISAGLEMVASQFAFWLNTKGIKPGAVGDVNATNFQSGISKILDEMDTSEDRNEQVPFFENAEAELWDLILNVLHPYWRERKLIENLTVLPDAVEVATRFSEQLPLVRRGQVVDEQVVELNNGLTTKELAIKRINPTMSDKQVADLIAEIGEDSVIPADTEPPKDDEETDDDDAA